MRESSGSIFWLLGALLLILGGYYFFYSALPRNEGLADPLTASYQFKETSCWFEVPPEKDIRCGELLTPSATGSFRLPVVRILDGSPERRLDPVVYLQGGPGGSAQLDTEGMEYWLNWLAVADIKRDFILMDPRGVGRSKPALVCDAYDRFSLNALRRNFSQREELEQSYVILEQCFKDLAREGFKSEYYGTEMAAQDLQALMTLLSIEVPEYHSFNLLGVSYGTRLAIAAATDFPRVRALVLDSVYPAGYGGLGAWPELFEQSMKNFFSWCEENSDCRSDENSPMLERLLLALQTLRDQPMTVHVTRWNREPPLDVVLNDHRFLSVMFSSIYSQHEWVHIGAAIDAAIKGEQRDLQLLVETFINNAFSDSFYSLAFMAVDCNDHLISPPDNYKNQLDEHPLFAEYLQDLWQYQACHLLVGANSKGLTQDSLALQPALLLAGALDPITPPQWARDIHQQWSASQLIVLEDVGHAVINSDECIHKNLRKFLDEPHDTFIACPL